MNNKREVFLNNIKQFIENGLVTEVFHNDIISIFNCANTIYVVTAYDISESYNKYYGLILDKDLMDYLSESNDNYASFLRGISKDLFIKQYLLFSDHTFKRFKEMKENTDVNGPSQYIDFNYEERWKEKMNQNKGVR